MNTGTGQAGIIPSCFFSDLTVSSDSKEQPHVRDQAVPISRRSGTSNPSYETIVRRDYPRETAEQLLAAEKKKKKYAIMSHLPNVGISNPIAAFTNFCRHQLKMEVEFADRATASNNPSEPIYTITVIVYILDSKGERAVRYSKEMASHSYKRHAKGCAAIRAICEWNVAMVTDEPWFMQLAEEGYMRSLG